MRVLRLLLIALCLAPAPSLAQVAASDAAPSDDAAADARVEFAAGERAYEEERYAEALEHFRRAQEIDPHDVARFNLAVCLQRLGRWREAWSEYDALTHSTELGAAERAYAAELRADLEARLATVRVRASEDAEVLLDGVSIGRAPIDARLEPGPHVIAVRAGTREASARLTVERGDIVERVLVLPAPEAASPPIELPREMRQVLRDPDWLTWVGGSLALIGAACIIGCGTHAYILHEQYTTAGEATWALHDEGVLYRDLAFGSIAVAAVGIAMVAVDLALIFTGDGAREVPVE